MRADPGLTEAEGAAASSMSSATEARHSLGLVGTRASRVDDGCGRWPAGQERPGGRWSDSTASLIDLTGAAAWRDDTLGRQQGAIGVEPGTRSNALFEVPEETFRDSRPGPGRSLNAPYCRKAGQLSAPCRQMHQAGAGPASAQLQPTISVRPGVDDPSPPCRSRDGCWQAFCDTCGVGRASLRRPPPSVSQAPHPRPGEHQPSRSQRRTTLAIPSWSDEGLIPLACHVTRRMFADVT